MKFMLKTSNRIRLGLLLVFFIKISLCSASMFYWKFFNRSRSLENNSLTKNLPAVDKFPNL
uniref:Candidate secreted effector n=1 Tax=Meloidogyne incognita TaxID=6306 RepID=A0A914L5P7_MELIC